MKVLMVRFGGIDGGNRKLLAGKVYEVPDELGQALLIDGRATKPIETTEAPMGAIERAVKRAPGRPRKAM